MKALYLLLLIVYVVGVFEQGKEGGELVYKHGLNVEQVKTLDDKIFDLEEALEEATEKTETVKEESAPVEAEATPAATEAVTAPVETSPAQSAPEATPVETTPVETIKETVDSVKTKVDEEVIKVQGMYEEMVQPKIATH